MEPNGAGPPAQAPLFSGFSIHQGWGDPPESPREHPGDRKHRLKSTSHLPSCPFSFCPCLLKPPLQIHTALKQAKTPQHSEDSQRRILKAKIKSCSKKAKWLKSHLYTKTFLHFPQLKQSLSALNSHTLSVMSPITFYTLKYNYSHTPSFTFWTVSSLKAWSRFDPSSYAR